MRREIIVLVQFKNKDASQLKITDPFLKEIVQYWYNLNYSEKNLVFGSTCIWHNSLITIEKRPFFYKAWLKARVENVKDLLDKASRFISFDDFVRKFNVKTNYREYYKIASTLTRSDKKLWSPERLR